LKRHLSIARGHDATVEEATSKGSVPVPNTMLLMGISSMDEEHELCDKALRVLREQRTLTALQRVMEVLEKHFAHEEGLMVKYGFGGSATDSFSALNSHVQDHKRILELGQAELNRMQVLTSTTTSSCGGASGASTS
jgi:hemerythrin